MHSALVTILATLGTAIGISAMLPQVIRTWRTRSADDFSAISLAFGLVGGMSWLCYGILIDAHAVVFANALGIMQSLFLLVMKWRSSRSAIYNPNVLS